MAVARLFQPAHAAPGSAENHPARLLRPRRRSRPHPDLALAERAALEEDRGGEEWEGRSREDLVEEGFAHVELVVAESGGVDGQVAVRERHRRKYLQPHPQRRPG